MCAWKYGLSFRAIVTNAKESFSIYGYLSSSPRSARLVKYTGFFSPSSSLIKVALTTAEETAKYRNSSSPGLDKLSNGEEERYAFRSSNTCWHLVVHSNNFLNVQKKGRHLSAALKTNLFNAATLPFKLHTSLTVFGGANSIMAFIFSRLTSIPLWDTKNPRNFLVITPNTHLFVWIQFYVVRPEGVEGLSEVAQVVVLSYTFYQHIIHINLHISSNLMRERPIHQPLVCGALVLEFKQHHFVAKEPLAGNK